MLRTPQEWATLEDIVILDPDGWRGKDAPPFDQPCTYEEYKERAWRCTIAKMTPYYKRLLENN